MKKKKCWKTKIDFYRFFLDMDQTSLPERYGRMSQSPTSSGGKEHLLQGGGGQ
jgi:hypothetical protein